jgi:hypothetical protein
MRVVVISPGERGKAATIRDSDRDKLFDLQHLVGGYVEAVNTSTLNFQRNTMLVDEDGHSKGKARNVEAERISGYAGTIVGTAVLVGNVLTDEGMDWGNVNE